MLVDRSVSRWQDDRWVSEGEKLSDFRTAHAYVLLGEPGAGKSTAFEEERRNDGNAVEVTARRFIRRSLEAHPEWRGATLLIDGLDEVRAGGGDLREPLDSLVCRLEKLGIRASGFPVARTPGWAEMTSANCLQSPPAKKFTSCASIRSAGRMHNGSWRPPE